MGSEGTGCVKFGHAAVSADGPAGPPGVRGDRKVWAEPPLPMLPEAGGSYVNPTFGTTIMRLTDASDGKEIR